MLCTGQYNSATIAGPAPFIWRRVLSSWARELGRSGQWYVFGGNFIQKITEIYKILSYKGHIKDLNVFWIEACPNRSCLCSDGSLCRRIWFVRSSNLRVYGIGFCLVGHGNWVGWVGRVSGMFLVATSSKKTEIYKILSYKGHIKDLNVFWIEACPNRSCLCSDGSLCRRI